MPDAVVGKNLLMEEKGPTMADHIYTTFDKMLGRSDKEELLKQTGIVVWMYGLSGSGKSTIANGLERILNAKGILTQVLDGDNIRSGLNTDLGFTDGDRSENIRRIAEVAKLFLNLGVVTLVSFITPRRDFRAKAREIIGEDDFLEVFVKAPFEVCAERDPKGLYSKVNAGEVANFTGKTSRFEEPEPSDPVFVLDTEQLSIKDGVDALFNELKTRIESQR